MRALLDVNVLIAFMPLAAVLAAKPEHLVLI